MIIAYSSDDIVGAEKMRGVKWLRIDFGYWTALGHVDTIYYIKIYSFQKERACTKIIKRRSFMSFSSSGATTAVMMTSSKVNWNVDSFEQKKDDIFQLRMKKI